MTHKVQFHWDLKDFELFINNEDDDILSETFSASSNGVSHVWRIKLRLNSTNTPRPRKKQKYGIFIQLMDNPVDKPISLQFHFELLDFEDCLFSKTFTAIRTFGKDNLMWGFADHIRYDTVFKTLQFSERIRIITFLEFKDSSSSFYSLQGYPSYEAKLFKQYKVQKYTDLIIQCHGKLFKTHKLILLAASSAFETLLLDKNNEISSSPLTILPMNDISPDVLEDVLEFIYTGKVILDYGKAKDLLQAATKYKLTDLTDMCLCKIESHVSVSTAVEIMTLFDKYGGSGKEYFKGNLMSFMKANLTDVMNSTGWKEIMIKRGFVPNNLAVHLSHQADLCQILFLGEFQ